MRSKNRCAVLTGSLFALASVLAAASSRPALAAPPASYVFEGKRIVFTELANQPGNAISIDDPGLHELLNTLGATVTFQNGQRYVLITTAEPVVISFAIGDRGYDVGPVRETAPFAPFTIDGHAYVPLDELLRALDLAPKAGGVLQPQLANLDVVSDGGGTRLVAHGGIPLDARITSQSVDRLTIAFDGVGSFLQPSQDEQSGAVRRIEVRGAGTVTHPVTYVTLYLEAGSTHTPLGTDDQRDVTLGFDGAAAGQSVAAAPPQVAQQAQPPQAQAVSPEVTESPAAAGAPEAPQLAQVTGVQTQPQNGSFVIRVSVDGSASYEWHRLRPPDNRWWIDVHGARLASPPAEETGNDLVTDVRSHQENAGTVRVALSLADYETVNVVPDASGVTITVNNRVADTAGPRTGAGIIGQNATAYASPPANWKFAPQPSATTYVAANPRLIVIDAGHGGSDVGAMRGDLMEKTLNLDMSKRLRDILVTRGWQVIMTRESDRDVYQPNDSATDELQARDDIANANGARLFVSVHSNSFINAGPHGATVYFYKPNDYALAQAVDRRIASELGIYNNGVLKDKLYVVHHADMPAALVETAFLSNPDDRQLLASPEWRQKMAEAIADGIGDYTGPPPPATSASNR